MSASWTSGTSPTSSMIANSPVSGSLPNESIYFNPHQESLTFEESSVTYYLSAVQHVKLTNAVVIRHHRLDDSEKGSLYQPDAGYLQTVFKQYLESLKKSQEGQEEFTSGWSPQTRTVFIAQFQPAVLPPGRLRNLPTYGVSFEIEIAEEAGPAGQSQPVVLIAYRELTRASFLSTALGTWTMPVKEETSRLCLLLQRGHSSDPQSPCLYQMQPRLMSPSKMANSRIITVARHGWLVVFLANCTSVYILIDNEYLILDQSMADVPLLYKRIQDVGLLTAEADELYYRKTLFSGYDADKAASSSYSPGMITSRAVVHNEFEINTFAIIGTGNAAIDYAHLQKIVSLVDQDGELVVDGEDSETKESEA